MALTAAPEQHYTPTQVAAWWSLSTDTIRGIFGDEPGVLKIERPERMNKRGYVSLRIPGSVLERVRLRLAA